MLAFISLCVLVIVIRTARGLSKELAKLNPGLLTLAQEAQSVLGLSFQSLNKIIAKDDCDWMHGR
jgi:hypothetical protein